MNVSLDIVTYVALGLSVIAITLAIRIELRLKKLLEGTDKKSLESSISELKSLGSEYGAFKKRIENHLKAVDGKLSGTVRGFAIVRFDAFDGGGTGGNQSFATAYVNESGDGVIISSIHSRERSSVFAKPLKNGTSEYELTPEEKQAISEAKDSISK